MWTLCLCLLNCAAQMPHMWWHAEGAVGSQMWASPIFNDNGSMVFVGSQDRQLYALDARSGKQLWQIDTGSLIMSSPAFDKQNQLVVVGSVSGNVSAVAASGPGNASDWSLLLQGSINTSPATSPDGAIVFVTTDANTLNALDATSGSKLWTTTVCDGCPVGTEVSEPLVDPEGTMVVVGGATIGNQTKALAFNGTMLWRHAGGTTRKASVFVGDMVVLSDSSGVSGLNKPNGTLRWRWNVDKQVRLSSVVLTPFSPTLGGRQMLVLLGDNKGLSIVFALNTAGKELWRLTIEDQLLSNPTNRASFSPDGTLLLVTGISGNLYGIDTDGELRWSYTIPGISIPRLLSAPICSDSTIYVAAVNNSVFSLQYVPPTNKSLSMADYIKNSPDLQEMASLLTLLPDLKALLSAPGDWTMFVPSDDAVKVFSTRIGGTGFAVWVNEQAPHVFKYYTLPGIHKTFALATSQFLPTRLVNDTLVNLGPGVAQPLLVTIRDPEDMEVDPTVGLRATIESSDLRFSNGVIHIIDTVILPPNRTTEVLKFWACDDFVTLIKQNPASVTVFEQTPGVTIFAPSSGAFSRASYWVKSVPQALNATLANFHVVPRLLYSASLKDGMKLLTITNDTLTVTINGSGTFISDGLVVGKVEMVDRLTQTGVIHTISEVLSPAPSASRTIGANIFFDRSLSALSELLSDASFLPFVNSLNGANMTFFAPFDVSPREINPLSDEVAVPSPKGFPYHIANGIRQRIDMGVEYVPTRLNDPAWVQLGGASQRVRYSKSKYSTQLAYGLLDNNLTISTVLSAPIVSSNGIYIYIDQWMVPPPKMQERLTVAGLTSVIEYLQRAKLMEAVNNMSHITVFAPTNNSFSQERFWADSLTIDVLGKVLQYHIVPLALYSTDLVDGRVLTTLTGSILTVRVDANGTRFLTSNTSDGCKILLDTLLTSNGVIYSVDNVLSPPSSPSVPLLTNMAYRKDLSLVTSRIVQQPQFSAINSLLSNTNMTLTAFMPTNEGWNTALTNEELIETMLYSMLDGSYPTKALSGLQFLPSLLKNTPSVRVGGNKSQVLQLYTVGGDVNVLFGWDSENTTDRTAHVVQKDVQSSNGYLQVIDNTILVPPLPVKAMNLSGLDRMASLVMKANLTLSFEAPALTIFAASDAALSNIEGWIKGVRADFLALVLKYHVVPGVLYSIDLIDEQQLVTLSGDILTVQRDGDQINLETAEGQKFSLLRKDLLTANGVIHEIEALMGPPPQANFSLVDNIALQPDLSTLSALLTLPMFGNVLKALSGPNVTFMAPSDAALAHLANYTKLETGVIPGYFKLTLNQSLLLHALPASLMLSAGQTLSPTIAPTNQPTKQPTTTSFSAAAASSSSLYVSVGQDIPGPRWPSDGSPLFVETLLDGTSLPDVVRLGNHSQSVRFERTVEPNETSYTLSSGPPLANWTANVVRRDLKAANGFIQIIDQVLSPGVPCTIVLPPMGLTEMAGLIVPDRNNSHWIERETGLTIFATTNAAIANARNLDDLAPETVLRRQAYKGILTLSQLRKIAAATDKSARKIVMFSGDAMAVTIGTDNSVHIGDSHVAEGDFILANGRMHVVDGLLVAANDNGVSPWIYVAIAAGCLLCIGAVVVFFYRRSRKSQNFDFQRIPDPST